LNAQGVIAESIISFKITWDNPGNGAQPKWDQNKQHIEIHEADIYPDLQYVSAYAAPTYVKYNSGSLLNELIVAINQVIESKISKSNEAQERPLPDNRTPKGLLGEPGKKELMRGHEIAQDLITAPVRGGELATIDKPTQTRGGEPVTIEKPNTKTNIDTSKPGDSEPEVTNDAQIKSSNLAYTVTIYGDKLRFLEGQEERGAYSAGVKFLYKVSNNLTKVVGDDHINNQAKIWAEVKMGGLIGSSIKIPFSEFDEKEFRFGGNLLAQILPSIELSFTPDQNSVYSKEKPELDIADVIKATNITLGNKTTTEIKALQKQIQKEIEARESEMQDDSSKQSDSNKNK